MSRNSDDTDFDASFDGFSTIHPLLPDLPLDVLPEDAFPADDAFLDGGVVLEELLPPSSQPANFQGRVDEDENEAEDDDDGLYTDTLPPSLDDGSFGDDEEVDVAVDAQSWKIDHSKGQHKLRGVSLRTRSDVGC